MLDYRATIELKTHPISPLFLSLYSGDPSLAFHGLSAEWKPRPFPDASKNKGLLNVWKLKTRSKNLFCFVGNGVCYLFNRLQSLNFNTFASVNLPPSVQIS